MGFAHLLHAQMKISSGQELKRNCLDPEESEEAEMHVVSNFLHLITITWSLKLLKPIYFLTHMVCSPIQFNFCPLILYANLDSCRNAVAFCFESFFCAA